MSARQDPGSRSGTCSLRSEAARRDVTMGLRMRLGFTRLGCLVAILLLLPAAHVPLEADEDPLTVQITSPLGRTGIPGTIRIVARVRTAEDQAVMLTRFYVDGGGGGEVSDGPPYAVPWNDENPFDPARIKVEA